MKSKIFVIISMLITTPLYLSLKFHNDRDVITYKSQDSFITLASEGEFSDLNLYEYYTGHGNIITSGTWSIVNDTLMLDPHLQICDYDDTLQYWIIPINLPDTLRDITKLKMTLLIRDNANKLIDVTEYGRIFPDFDGERFTPIVEFNIIE